jgi:integrase-like protein
MRHSYATWLLQAGADIHWVKDQLGHASTEETEGTYGHLVRENHERHVEALDLVLWPRTAAENSGEPEESRDSPRPTASPYVLLGTGQPLRIDRSEAESMVEGKGFNDSPARNIANLRDAILQNAAKRGRPRPTASQSPPHLPRAFDTRSPAF